jgi:hypothetical protein
MPTHKENIAAGIEEMYVEAANQRIDPDLMTLSTAQQITLRKALNVSFEDIEALRYFSDQIQSAEFHQACEDRPKDIVTSLGPWWAISLDNESTISINFGLSHIWIFGTNDMDWQGPGILTEKTLATLISKLEDAQPFFHSLIAHGEKRIAQLDRIIERSDALISALGMAREEIIVPVGMNKRLIYQFQFQGHWFSVYNQDIFNLKHQNTPMLTVTCQTDNGNGICNHFYAKYNGDPIFALSDEWHQKVVEELCRDL